MLEEAGADHVITLHLHSDQIQGFFKIPVDALDARQIFTKHFATRQLANPIVVSPDVGGAKQAKKFADAMGTDLAILHKTRSGHHEAMIVEVAGDVNGRTCILYDDMIDTAGTLSAARDALLKRNAQEIIVAATHGLFSGPALERLTEANFSEVVVTDSTPINIAFPGLTVLPIAPLLAKVIEHVESGKSVTAMYEGNS